MMKDDEDDGDDEDDEDDGDEAPRPKTEAQGCWFGAPFLVGRLSLSLGVFGEIVDERWQRVRGRTAKSRG